MIRKKCANLFVVISTTVYIRTYASYVLFFNFDRIFYIYYNILYFYNFNNTSISLLHLSLCAVPPKQTKYHSRLLIVGIKDIHTYILNTSSCHTITEEHKIIDISTYLGIFFTIQLNFYLKFFFLVLKYQPFIVIF